MAKTPEEITVLIVEDHMGMRKIIRTVLQSIGVKHLLEAADGAEALKILHESTLESPQVASNQVAGKNSTEPEGIDLVICDWAMPRKSGIEVLAGVRKNPRLAALPFLMLTAESSRDNILQAAELGVDDYIVKPFTAAVLEEKLRALLKRC